MSETRGIRGVLILLALALCLSPLGAEELHKNFAHKLSIGSSAQSYEHRIDLPEDWAAQGKYFVGRTLTLDGKLVIEREELTKTYYYVKVRLPKVLLWFAKGSIDINLKAAADQPTTPVLNAPTGLKVLGGSNVNFRWTGDGAFSAISLMNREDGNTMWERVILNDHECELTEARVKIGGKYLWAVQQADETGRYSKEAQGKFRIGTKQERCPKCWGSGYVTCTRCNGSGHIVVNGPDNTPVSQICYNCHGTGRERCIEGMGSGHVTVPVVVPED